jgi:sec-independent protein translocase protein TatA
MKDLSQNSINVTGPVETERQKLEMIGKSLGLDIVGKSDEELKDIISSEIGKKTDKHENS